MSDLFKGFEQLLELAKALEEKAEKGELKTDIQINSRSLSSIPRQGNIPGNIGVSRVRPNSGDAAGQESKGATAPGPDAIVTPPPASESESASLKDVGGLADVLKELRELIEIPLNVRICWQSSVWSHPEAYCWWDHRGRKNANSPWSGGRVGVNYIAIIGPEVMGKYYGEAEGRLRSIFEKAAKAAPCIVFIDEIDSLAPIAPKWKAKSKNVWLLNFWG